MCEEDKPIIDRPITIDELNALVRAGVITSIDQFELVDIDYGLEKSYTLMRDARAEQRGRKRHDHKR